MSSVFNAYARYYDLLYRDKDYAAEVDYVMSLVGRYAPKAKRILELGCGTGMHAELLARKGYEVHGIDLSESMLAGAEARKRSLPSEVADKLSFSLGNARSIRLNEQFDIVLSLFHVMSYQTTETAISAAFDTAAIHLVKGGILFFDYWYGPAVLSQKPATRIKRLGNEDIQVTRIAEPVLRENENIVDVNYEIWIDDRKGGIERLSETHNMRYWFLPELAFLLEQTGFEHCSTESWLSELPPSCDSWAACTTARRR